MGLVVANDLDVESILGHTDALVHGRSYVTVSQAIPEIDLNVDPEVPIIRVESPTSLYAKIDPKSRQVSKAIRVIYDDDGQLSATTIYLPDQTVIMERDGSEWKTVNTLSTDWRWCRSYRYRTGPGCPTCTGPVRSHRS